MVATKIVRELYRFEYSEDAGKSWRLVSTAGWSDAMEHIVRVAAAGDRQVVPWRKGFEIVPRSNDDGSRWRWTYERDADQVCTQCGPGHAGSDGRCKRHGKLIRP